MSSTMGDWMALPGPQAARETAETNFLWFRGATAVFQNGVVVLSSTLDSGSSTTTQLRAGLLMGKITSSSKYTQYSPTATDGSQVVAGVLVYPVSMIGPDGVAVDKMNVLVVGGCVKNASLQGLDAQARQQMRGRFIFDDDYQGNYTYPWRQELSKTANYTVTAADKGTLFDNAGAVGAVIFTLPTLANGLCYGFSVQADQNVTISSAAGDDMIAPNDASADSVAFTTGGDKVGAMVVVYSNPGATKWVVEKRCSNAMTIAT